MAKETKVKERKTLTIKDAMENLSALASVEIDPSKPLGVIKKHKLVIQDEDFADKTIVLIVPENAGQVLEHVKKTLRVLLEYFQEIYEDSSTDWEDERVVNGIELIMDLTGKMGEKLGEYISLYPVLNFHEDIIDSEEYKALQKYYLEKIALKLGEKSEGAEKWEEEWEKNPKKGEIDSKEADLADFESVKRDHNYELFDLVDSDGEPYFTEELKRNIRMVCQIDESANTEFYQDPLMKMREINDKDFSTAAMQILQVLEPSLKKYYHLHLHKAGLLARRVNKVLMALMLAANPKNQLSKAINKSSFSYFEDFYLFLDECLHSEEYIHMIGYPETITDPKQQEILELLHSICRAFFMRWNGVKEEMIGFIFHLIKEGKEPGKKQGFFEQLISDDQAMRRCLEHYPHGSLFKILDVIAQNEPRGFCPIRQDNFPFRLYEIGPEKEKIAIVKLPSPTTQTTLDDAHIIHEFAGFMRSYLHMHKKHILFDVHNKQSLLDKNRSDAIEKFCKSAEFSKAIEYVGFTRSNDFYLQKEKFLKLDDAKSFIETFYLELQNGFINTSAFLDDFYKQLLDTLHREYFNGEKKLSRVDRLHFIELASLFIIVKILEIHQSSSVSFTGKDGLDVGGILNFELWAFIHELQGQEFTDKDREFALWIIYSQPLQIRERLTDSNYLMRGLNALSFMQKVPLNRRQKVLKKLYEKEFLKSWNLQ